MLAAAAAWLGALTGARWGWWAVALALAAGVIVFGAGQRAPAVVVLVGAVAAVSGHAAASGERAVLEAGLPGGRVMLEMVALGDVDPGPYAPRLVAQPAGGGHPLLVTGPVGEVAAGDRLRVEGTLVGRPRWVRGDPVAGTLRARRVERLGGPEAPLLAVANALRAHTLEGISPESSPGRALLAGFLVGDTRALAGVHDDAMRRAGLSHFVAVSGSNVALFLGLWWLVLAPVRRPRVRWATGLVALVVFVLLTRWEPSVIRASAMAGLVLAGRLVGVPLSTWTALGSGVTGCLLISGGLATDVGFALSVAATAGVLAGRDLVGVGPAPVRTVLGASLSAQLAVAPILIAVFGSVPLLSPVANLIAAPLVTLATAAGGIGALVGIDPVVGVGAGVAHLVLQIAEVAAPWPQVGWVGLVVLAGGVIGLMARPVWAPALVLVAGAAVAVGVWPLSGVVERPAVVVLDVGQGDAVLVLDPELTVLVDGGPDPVRLARALDRHRVDRLDLVVATHVHADHVTGLVEVVERMAVARLWHAFPPHETEQSLRLLEAARVAGLPIQTPAVGAVLTGEQTTIRVLGPLRRYDAANDQSIVLEVDLAGTRVLLPGDAETWAQADLGAVRPHVLKVPHQGAATSDPGWLAENAGQVAVISVGPNDYGHPDPGVIRVLRAAGATVLRTDQEGDVVIRPDRVQGRSAASIRRNRSVRPSSPVSSPG